MRKFFLALGVLLTVTACSLKDTAENVEHSTKNIEENSKHLSEQSDQIAARTEELLRGMRQLQMLTLLKDSRRELIASEGATLKLQKAMVFYAAFEFQKWTGKYTDTPQDLDELYALAVDLFFSSVDDLIPDSLPVDVMSPDNNWKSLASLAATMDFVDYKQKENMEAAGLQPVSIYALITEALKQEAQVNRGASVPRYVMKVLEWKKEALYLLQLRHNYFPAMVLARLTPFEESFSFQLKQTFWGSSVSVADINYAQLKEWGRWLENGIETQNFLKDLKEPLAFNKNIQRAFAHLKFVSDAAPLGKELIFIRKAQNDFLAKVTTYRQAYQNSK
jgi:hypothetical protein